MTETQSERPPDTRPLFRPEAIEAHARGRGVDDEGLELAEGRTAWAFRLLLVALAVAIGAGLTVKIEETAKGHAPVVAGQSVTVDLPIGAQGKVAVGQAARLNSARGKVVIVGDPRATDGVATLPVTVTFDSGEVVPGEVTVVLARRTLAALLLGRDDG